ncbi:MAG: threonine synthase [Proteobacteria bacterium]|nr:threonine synthase [Pseudomonadota bacterium]
MTYLTHLECTVCGTRLSADRPRSNTCKEGGVLEARYDLARARRELDRDAIARGPATMWRYGPLLPVRSPAAVVSLAEGWTPMLRAPALERELGLAELWIKDEGRNPSGSFKDRGASVAVSKLREFGVETVVHNSSGNAGAAWGLYAARAGIACVNLLSGDALPSTVKQAGLAGSKVFLFDGRWQESGATIERAVRRHGWFNIGTLKEPYRLEGKKTMGYEICEQLGWEFPDMVVYPTSGALGAIAIFKAFRELAELGWVAGGRRPRLLAVQYEGCAPIVRAFREGRERPERWEADLDVPPGGLKSPAPPGGREVLKILRETRGAAIAVSAPEAVRAAAEIARREGIFACPEGATTLVGLRRALAEGLVGRHERIVLMNTASGLKSVPVLPEAEVARIPAGDDLPALPAAG